MNFPSLLKRLRPLRGLTEGNVTFGISWWQVKRFFVRLLRQWNLMLKVIDPFLEMLSKLKLHHAATTTVLRLGTSRPSFLTLTDALAQLLKLVRLSFEVILSMLVGRSSPAVVMAFPVPLPLHLSFMCVLHLPLWQYVGCLDLDLPVLPQIIDELLFLHGERSHCRGQRRVHQRLQYLPFVLLRSLRRHREVRQPGVELVEAWRVVDPGNEGVAWLSLRALAEVRGLRDGVVWEMSESALRAAESVQRRVPWAQAVDQVLGEVEMACIIITAHFDIQRIQMWLVERSCRLLGLGHHRLGHVHEIAVFV